MKKKPIYPLYKIYSKNTGNRYILEFQKIDRVLEPPKPTDYHESLMNRMAILEHSNKDSIEFNIVTPIFDISNVTDKEIPISIKFPGPMDLNFNFRVDPQTNNIKAKMGMRIKCVLRKVESYSQSL